MTFAPTPDQAPAPTPIPRPTSVAAAIAITNIASLSGVYTFDDWPLISGNVVLLTGQTNANENGLWIVNAVTSMSTGRWERALDYQVGQVVRGRYVNIVHGTTYGSTVWALTTDLVTVGSTASAWQQVAGTGGGGGPPSGAAGGDLRGTYPNPIVQGIQGLQVTTSGPTNGYGLTWNSGASQLQWTAGGTPGGSAGGDLSGTYPGPTVVAIQGEPIATTTPAANNVLAYNGTQWGPGTVPSSSTIGANAQNSNYTFVIGDAGLEVQYTSSSAGTYTIPLNSSVAFPVNSFIVMAQLGTGQLTVAGAAGVTVNTPSSRTTRAQFSQIAIKQTATNVWVVSGDMT